MVACMARSDASAKVKAAIRDPGPLRVTQPQSNIYVLGLISRTIFGFETRRSRPPVSQLHQRLVSGCTPHDHVRLRLGFAARVW